MEGRACRDRGHGKRVPPRKLAYYKNNLDSFGITIYG